MQRVTRGQEQTNDPVAVRKQCSLLHHCSTVQQVIMIVETDPSTSQRSSHDIYSCLKSALRRSDLRLRKDIYLTYNIHSADKEDYLSLATLPSLYLYNNREPRVVRYNSVSLWKCNLLCTRCCSHKTIQGNLIHCNGKMGSNVRTWKRNVVYHTRQYSNENKDSP